MIQREATPLNNKKMDAEKIIGSTKFYGSSLSDYVCIIYGINAVSSLQLEVDPIRTTVKIA